MADYFIDLSAGSNGDGSSGSPWNQFTAATEHASVSSGDFLWFRRCDTTTLIEFIDLDIDYVGWPLNNDPLYATRPVALQASWDPDIEEYCVQTTTTISIWTLEPFSNCTIHRFNGEFDYQGYLGTGGSLKLDTKQNITFNYCKYSSWSGSSATSGFTLSLYNCTNITFNNSIVHEKLEHATVSYAYPTMFRFEDCTNLVFNYSQLIFSNSSWQNLNTKYFASQDELDSRISRTINTICYFNNSDFTSYIYSGADQFLTAGAQCIMSFMDNSVVTISGGSTNLINTYNYTLGLYIRYAGDTFFYTKNAALSVYNHTLDIPSSNITWITGGPGALLTVDNVHVKNWGNGLSNFLNTRDASCELHLTSISGSLPIVDTHTDYSYIFMNLFDIDMFEGTTSTVSDINLTGTVPILNCWHSTSDVPAPDVSIDENNNLFSNINNITLFATNTLTINFKNITLDSLVVVSSGYSLSYQLAGSGLPNNYYINVKNTQFNSPTSAIYLRKYSGTVSKSTYVNIYGSSGGGILLERDGTYVMNNLELYSKYNTSFNSLVNNVPNKYEIVSLSDTFVANSLSIDTNTVTQNTSVVNRIGGAGFSNFSKAKIDSIQGFYQFPRIGQDNLWINIPTAGSYTITGYILHAGTTPLTTNDVEMVIEKHEGTYTPAVSAGLIADGSVWTEVTNSTPYKLIANVTVAYAQYIAVHFIFNDISTAHSFYIDPKLEIT